MLFLTWVIMSHRNILSKIDLLSACESGKIIDLPQPQYRRTVLCRGQTPCHPRGPDISSKVLGAIGNPHRFDNGRQVLKLAGLDLSAEQSGKKTEVAHVISKKGKADLRYGLYRAALVASTRNHRFMTYFTNKLKGREREKGIKTKMRVKLTAKMLGIAWTLMKKKEVFNPDCITNNC